jgi:gliding motility-associated-like protein
VLDALNVVVTNDSCETGVGSITAITLSGGTAPIIFEWNGTAAAGLDFTGTNGTYTLTVTDAEGCFDTAGPFIIGGTQAVTGSVSGPTSACQGAPVTLTASGGVLYSWGGGNLSNVNTFTLNQDSTLLVVVSNGDCIDSVYTTVTVLLQPEIVVGTVSPECPGETVTMTASSASPITWSSGGSGSPEIITVSTTQYYYATATNACGSVTDSVLVTALSIPVIDAGSDVEITLGSSITLQASGGVTYTWSPADGLSCTNCSNPVASPTSTTNYTVVGIGVDGCEATDQILVTVVDNPVVWLPDAFSPNGDGYNDVFQVYGSGIAEMTLSVFDRWGNLIFESDNQQQGWDGWYKGEPLGRATFGYTLNGKFNNGNAFEQSGNVTLMR